MLKFSEKYFSQKIFILFFLVKGNEASFEMFGNIIFVEMKSSKLK
jgi:hypothetical protein